MLFVYITLVQVDAALVLAERQEEMLDEIRGYAGPCFKQEFKTPYSRTGFPGKGILSAINDNGKSTEEKFNPQGLGMISSNHCELNAEPEGNALRAGKNTRRATNGTKLCH